MPLPLHDTKLKYIATYAKKESILPLGMCIHDGDACLHLCSLPVI